MKDTPVTSSTSMQPAGTEQPIPKAPQATDAKATFWGVFLSTFVTIFLAELGDNTQVALALISTSLVGGLVGQWLARRISPETLDTLAGVLLLIISVGLVADVIGL